MADGRLRDVSHLAKGWNPFPTFITAGLWDVPDLEHREERVRQFINLIMLQRWLERGKHGEFTIHFDRNWFRYPLHLRVVVEPDAEYGTVITVLLEGERLDFAMPRPTNGGSFFVM